MLAGTRPGRDEELLAVFGERAVDYRLDAPGLVRPAGPGRLRRGVPAGRLRPRPCRSGYRTDPRRAGWSLRRSPTRQARTFWSLAWRPAPGPTSLSLTSTRPDGGTEQRFPAEVGQAFDDYLSRFGEHETRARDLLRALAYAEGPGLPAGQLWADMASALAAPRRYGTDDLAWLLDSAAGYLVESGDEDGQPVYRIFHQALIEHLRPQDKETQSAAMRW